MVTKHKQTLAQTVPNLPSCEAWSPDIPSCPQWILSRPKASGGDLLCSTHVSLTPPFPFWIRKGQASLHFATPTYSLAHLRHKENHFCAIRAPSAEPVQRAWLPFCWPIASLQWWHLRSARGDMTAPSVPACLFLSRDMECSVCIQPS